MKIEKNRFNHKPEVHLTNESEFLNHLTRRKKLTEFAASTRLPDDYKMASQYHSIQDYNEDIRKLRENQELRREIHNRITKAENLIKRVTQRIRRSIPVRNTWFKFGDKAVALQWTNWGGGQETLLIEDWKESGMRTLRDVHYN